MQTQIVMITSFIFKQVLNRENRYVSGCPFELQLDDKDGRDKRYSRGDREIERVPHCVPSAFHNFKKGANIIVLIAVFFTVPNGRSEVN